MENPVRKKWRPRSDATLYGILSGSALFAYDPFTGFQVKNGLKILFFEISRPEQTVPTCVFEQ